MISLESNAQLQRAVVVLLPSRVNRMLILNGSQIPVPQFAIEAKLQNSSGTQFQIRHSSHLVKPPSREIFHPYISVGYSLKHVVNKFLVTIELRLNCWSAQWHENGSHRIRQFRAAFGILKAKESAEEFRRKLEASGRVDNRRTERQMRMQYIAKKAEKQLRKKRFAKVSSGQF
ncbi:hypothetical protein IE077_000560 [Cardiosporidium cionae]|uniref:Ribosomal protein S21 n=1 Tax=Cardiosporidium cionae TaxID=476202 RepID=A0ABQ7JF78_9APIC|nr:hypothetical protein IE077_000560 [Cardiosporidium cionae]|eukprot:KAF8822540.1 hypothetical protein IE077_000560 [Cardiosporidium cionae]